MTLSRWSPDSTRPRTYFTPFDPTERITNYYARLNPHLPQWNITSAATLLSSTPITIQSLRSAWISLRYHHPMIAATISKDGNGLEYTVPTNEELEQWVKETMIIDRSGRTGREISTALKVPNSGKLYYLPDHNEIFLHFPHEISDGMGSIILLNNLIRTLKSSEEVKVPEEFGGEVERLPPSLFAILGKPGWKDESFGLSDAEAKRAGEISDTFFNNDSISIMAKKEGVNASTVPTLPSGRVEHAFTVSETAEILKACKERGITVTNAVIAAHALETLERSGSDNGGINTLVSVNLRPNMQEPYNKQGGGNMFVDTFSVFDALKGKGFVDLAREVKDDLLAWKNNNDYVGYTPLLVHRLEQLTRKAVEDGIMGNPGFVMSSLGVVERYLEEEVVDYWFGIGVSSISAGCVFVWTIKGRLTVAVCYNEVWFGEGVVEEYLKGLVGGLRRGLQLGQ